MISSTGPERDFEHAKLLMQEYSFDLSRFKASELVTIWHEHLQAEPSWIRAAVLEALYLGRYKAFSVEQILQGWKRRGHPVRHFNSEFERIVFSPIDPAVSQYVAMTASSPSELIASQVDGQQNAAASQIASDDIGPAPATAQSTSPSPDESSARAATDPLSPPIESDQQQSLLTSEIAAPAPKNSDLSSLAEVNENEHAADSDDGTSPFSQPEPIQKFTPELESSEFYQRLQAVARHSDK